MNVSVDPDPSPPTAAAVSDGDTVRALRITSQAWPLATGEVFGGCKARTSVVDPRIAWMVNSDAIPGVTH